MTLYKILLFVHVLAAAAWAGGALYNFLLGWKLRRTNDPLRMAAFAREASEFGGRFFAPVAVITVLAGIWLVIEGDVGFEHFWILSAFAVWIYSIVSNITWLARLSDRIGALVAEKGPTSPEVRSASGEMFRWRAIEVSLLVLVVFTMTYKPFA